MSAAARRIRDLSFFRAQEPETPDSSERLGKPSETRPEGCLLWVLVDSGDTAGSVVSVCKELSYLREEPVHCLVTTTRDTPLVPSVARTVLHQLSPVETQGSISRFLTHWTPDVGIVLGDVDAPKLLTAAAGQGVPLFHVGLERGELKRVPEHFKYFKSCLAASAAEARLLRQSLDRSPVQIEISGPLKDTIHALPCNEAEGDALAKLLGGRPVWLAANLHLDELDEIEIAHRRAFHSAHRMLLILVPADLEQAGEIRQRLEKAGWTTGLRSDGDEPDPDFHIYIADTEEELGLWYRLAPTSFLGGTLAESQEVTDPFDPAALGSAVLHGPHLGAAAIRFQRLRAAGGSLNVQDGETLGAALESLLAPDKAAAMAQAGWSVTTESAAVVDQLVEAVDLALEGV